MAYVNSAGSDQIVLKEYSDQGLHCLPFLKSFWWNKCIKKQQQKLGIKSME